MTGAEAEAAGVDASCIVVGGDSAGNAPLPSHSPPVIARGRRSAIELIYPMMSDRFDRPGARSRRGADAHRRGDALVLGPLPGRRGGG
ncbi:hypothetical protein AB5I41_14215 [Sphingomonas sp. MMS24-JH45]